MRNAVKEQVRKREAFKSRSVWGEGLLEDRCLQPGASCQALGNSGSDRRG